MSEFKAMKFWIGDDPACSERVQKMLFGMGYTWYPAGPSIKNKMYGCFITDKDGSILTTTLGDFIHNEKEEINIDWLRTPKQETIEFNGKNYIKADLAAELGEQTLFAVEAALEKLKPVEEM